METACALWAVVLAPQFPLITDVTEFINVGSEVWLSTTLRVDMLYRFREATKGLTRTCGTWCVISSPLHMWRIHIIYL